MGDKKSTAKGVSPHLFRRKWGTPDEQECASQFITMIDRDETPHPPRRGKAIGSIRPMLKSNS